MLHYVSICCNLQQFRKGFIMSTAVRISNTLVKEAKINSKVENRSITGQIEYWAKIGKIAEENQDIPFSLIKEILLGLEQLDSNEGIEYNFE